MTWRHGRDLAGTGTGGLQAGLALFNLQGQGSPFLSVGQRPLNYLLVSNEELPETKMPPQRPHGP